MVNPEVDHLTKDATQVVTTNAWKSGFIQIANKWYQNDPTSWYSTGLQIHGHHYYMY